MYRIKNTYILQTKDPNRSDEPLCNKFSHTKLLFKYFVRHQSEKHFFLYFPNSWQRPFVENPFL